MLDEKTREIVKSTIPFLQDKGTEITGIFYQNMFKAHPELLNIFNQNNQREGTQSKALANTVLAAAMNIDDLSVLKPHVIQIGYKHRALQVKPEHYPIVGHHLIEAIGIVLGDAATDEIIDAWTAAYGEIAQVFIDAEKEMYKEEAWHDFKPFKVISVEKPAAGFVKIGLQSDFPIGKVIPGEYITVRIKKDGETYFSNRHYSIYAADETKNQVHIAIRKENEGIVSNYLIQDVKPGDEICLSAPAGDFCLAQDSKTNVLISSGIGMTPILPMAETSYEQGKKTIWIQNFRHLTDNIFEKEVALLCDKIDIITNETSSEGRINAEKLKKWLDFNEPMAFYLCGRPEFTIGMKNALIAAGANESDIYYEVFDAPKMATIFD
ncbi:globin domain-containing protein [Listeria aquatica]|uniref:nitric oxide dioxygenase n=1 Tax=Listeria aquatica FSL S10-1188 TaxID=1265818 RepID=W7ATG7_9LIST|nr:globin domain-containing protein [Listeria aquatica]EUJ16912.1 flavohemoprotein [Listeria aquatica FSL S10-1188]